MSNPLDQPAIPSPPSTPQPHSSPNESTSLPIRSTSEPLSQLTIEAPSVHTSHSRPEEEPDDGTGVQKLDLGEGNVVRLDRLGPMIINSDGTLSRIQNWQELSPVEQERTVRLLVKKRNLVRLRKLNQENEEGEEREGEQLTRSKEGEGR